MADDPNNKKTRKEGLSEAAREALERAVADKRSAADDKPLASEAKSVPDTSDVPARDDESPVNSEREAAVLAETRQDHKDTHAPKNTPHGKDDVDAKRKPSPAADSDDEAPLRTFKKIDPRDRERGEHRGPGRAADTDDLGHATPKKPPQKRTALMLAEYNTPGECMHAAEALRDAGYTKFDAHTPFPVHGMDKAMGLPDSKLGWIVLVCGLTGVTAAFSMMYWMNNVDYPIIIGGKPASIGSLPSMIPIMFELTILLSSFGAVFGMFHLNKLPRHHHPIFESDRFTSFSNDKFWVSVEADDPKFKLDRTRDLLDKTHPAFVEVVEEEVP
jgi:hypothetical protein